MLRDPVLPSFEMGPGASGQERGRPGQPRGRPATSTSKSGAKRPRNLYPIERPRNVVGAAFSDFDFGYATAELESAANPALLLKGYLDLHDVDAEVLRGIKFLFLGYKGSGKSAIGEHLRLRADRSAMLFVDRVFLADFPFAEFGQIVQGPSAGPARYPAAWSWLMCLRLMALVSGDQGSGANNDRDFQSSLELLKRLGLLPTPSLQEVVRRSSSKGFKASLPKLLEGQYTSQLDGQGSLNVTTMVEILQTILTSVRSQSRHFLIIDGLDDILLEGKVQYESLAALILEASRLNLRFREAGAPLKIVILCRTDIYERLPGPNKNKIRQDSAVHLDWYHDPTHPDQSALIALANMKARVTYSDVRDVFIEYLPSLIINGSRTRAIETRRFLLNHTRHTPRDLLQLLKYIQEYAPREPRTLTVEQVRNGVRSYSVNYFLPEIKDELVGHMSVAEIEAGFTVLGAMLKQSFYTAEFALKAARLGLAETVNTAFLSYLFEFGALGNMSNMRDKERQQYTYRYWNRQSPFNPDGRVNLHRGLLPALNIVYF